jgi:hypothetical protein
MGELNDAHEDFLSESLENPEFFGTDIIFQKRDGSVSYTVRGSVNKIMPQMQDGSQGRPRGKVVSVSARISTLQAEAGYPDDPDWELNMPAVTWLVILYSKRLKKNETFTIERGSISEDETLGLITYPLTGYQG